MGRDKASLAVGGVTLLDCTIGRLGSVVEDVLVVGREASTGCVSPVRFVPDELPGEGPLGGLLTGLRAARHPYCVVLACDLPFLEVEVLSYLLSLAPDHQAVVPRVGDHAQVLHAVYQRSVIPTIEHLLGMGERRVESLLDHIETRFVAEHEIAPLDPQLRSFVNVNTPEDWADVVHSRSTE
jgi:molybdopterin-guanine dinucleotide biosynthesis protein A